MRSLEQCLIDIVPAHLEAMARLWRLEEPWGRRRDLIGALVKRMCAPGELERVWAILSEEEQTALAALQAADGSIPWSTFTRRWGAVRAMGPGRMARERPWESPISPVERLWYWGLLFRTLAEGESGLYEVAYLPAELRPSLPVEPTPSPLELKPTPPPAVRRPATDFLLDDGCTLLAYLQNHRVRPGAEGAWPARDEAALVRRLRDTHPVRLALLRHLAQRAGWMRSGPDAELRPDPGPAAEWLEAGTAHQREVLARTWRDDPTWNDLFHVPRLQPDPTGSWSNDPLLARRAVLNALATCRPDVWYGIAAFTTAIKESMPDFQRPDGDYNAWYIRDAATGDYLSGFESWDAVEGALIRFLLTGPLAWLGLVDLGLESEDGPPVAFHLSAAGAAFLKLAQPQEPAAPAALTVRPDLRVLVPAARRYERFQLSRVADWVRTGDPYVYRLTASSLARADRQRISPERVLTFLEEAVEEELPQAVRGALSRWSQHGTQVRLERAILLRVEDAEILERLAAAPATRHLIREVVGPTAARITPADWPRLVQVLVEQGFLPDLTTLEEADAGTRD